eukprot:CAMPEP_0170171876 /NCGR_PEP_ID=MMETSP0040_2-20121228/5084_1 /TAXON_ID=641309 /ORGANISM="Lotharella oceanica, Strain CCMP622" /LENGTH=109 /DNA_ID=CAMNT_0010412203 /DNA_START=374 /DNA_END=704 /DNA_ORIENTATION=+
MTKTAKTKPPDADKGDRTAYVVSHVWLVAVENRGPAEAHRYEHPSVHCVQFSEVVQRLQRWYEPVANEDYGADQSPPPRFPFSYRLPHHPSAPDFSEASEDEESGDVYD